MLKVRKVVMEMTAGAVQVTTTPIYTPWIRFELDKSATGVARIGGSDVAGAATAYDSLAAGEAVEYAAGSQGGAWGKGGEMFNLADFYALGSVAAATEQLHVTYLAREK